MLLDIRNALKNPGQSYPISCTIHLDPMDVLDEQLIFDDVHLTGAFVGAGESVKITGQVGAMVHAHCALCLDPVSEPIEVSISEVFTKEPAPDDTDEDTYPLDGYEIDPTDLVRDALLLDLPLRFLCNENCRGFCPTCGINRNTQRCTCQEGRGRKHPFSALSELLTEDEEV